MMFVTACCKSSKLRTCVCKLFEIIPIPRVKVHALSIYSKQVIIFTHVILTNHGCSQKKQKLNNSRFTVWHNQWVVVNDTPRFIHAQRCLRKITFQCSMLDNHCYSLPASIKYLKSGRISRIDSRRIKYLHRTQVSLLYTIYTDKC